MPSLSGVHHTARPTWKLAETVRFYRDIIGLPVFHAVSAKGWGPENHPDFIHFFFDSGNGSTIAFFYYFGEDEPEHEEPSAWHRHSTHTAWRVENEQQLLDWKERFEAHGIEVMQVRHEIIDSIYVTDPNGYMVEFTLQVRELTEYDRLDASLTLDAAIAIEQERGTRLTEIESLWRRKADLVKSKLAEVA
ncbi:VOC family protein [Sphingomonas cavernae]|uniref:VOC family protein n=1 Tax=Sphingomonas cavernae TaxID=2320861 RepID=UPI001C722268|nr:VOC family protein [Sphingomonas cavernae]